MQQILITQVEASKYSYMNSILVNPQQMTCNTVNCIYAEISQNDLDNYSQSWDSDAWEGVVLPKEVIEG